MPTNKSQSDDAPRPMEAPVQAQQATAGKEPPFVPPNLARQRQQLPAPGVGPQGQQALAGTALRGAAGQQLRGPGAQFQQRHLPRSLAQQQQQGRRMQRSGAKAGVFAGPTTASAQWSVDYPNDVWFYDSQAGWLRLDPTSANGIEAMNLVIGLARQQQSTLYYDTDPNSGDVIDVYAF